MFRIASKSDLLICCIYLRRRRFLVEYSSPFPFSLPRRFNNGYRTIAILEMKLNNCANMRQQNWICENLDGAIEMRNS